jgi:hypothetical protein
MMKIADSFWIDERGAVEHGSPISTFSVDGLNGDGVEVRGHVEWSVGATYLRIRLRPALTTPAAHYRLSSWLHSTCATRILLCAFIGHEWQYEILGDTKLAAQRVDTLMQQHGSPNKGYLKRDILPLSEPLRDHGFAGAFDFWKQNRQAFSPAQVLATLDPLLNSSWLLFERANDDGYRLTGFGANNPQYAAKWFARNIGAPIAGMPDPDYAVATINAYRHVELTDEPCLDNIEAYASWLTFGRVRSKYSRLILPFKFDNKTWLVVGKLKRAKAF